LFVLEELVQKENHLLYPFIGSWNVRFNEVIKKGTFVYAWNKEVCKTAYAQKYLASGTSYHTCFPSPPANS